MTAQELAVEIQYEKQQNQERLTQLRLELLRQPKVQFALQIRSHRRYKKSGFATMTRQNPERVKTTIAALVRIPLRQAA
jgi:hypothetical protein